MYLTQTSTLAKHFNSEPAVHSRLYQSAILKDEMAQQEGLVLAALLLTSAKKEITAENLSSVVKAAGLSIDAKVASSFATLLQKQKVDQVLGGLATAASGPAPAGKPAAPAAAGKPAAAAAPAPVEEEEDVPVEFDLF